MVLATEVLVHSMRGTPKSVLMLERLGAKLLQQGRLEDTNRGVDISFVLEGDEVELGPIAEDNGQRNEVSDGEEEGDGEKRGQAENQGGVEIEAGDESGCGDEDEHEIDLANTSQTEMDESDNSALNHSSLSEGTMQFEDASNAISAMLDAAEASATGLLSTPEREKANAVAGRGAENC